MADSNRQDASYNDDIFIRTESSASLETGIKGEGKVLGNIHPSLSKGKRMATGAASMAITIFRDWIPISWRIANLIVELRFDSPNFRRRRTRQHKASSRDETRIVKLSG